MILDDFEKLIAQFKSIEFFISCVSNEDNEEALKNIQLMLEKTRKDFFELFNELERKGIQ